MVTVSRKKALLASGSFKGTRDKGNLLPAVLSWHGKHLCSMPQQGKCSISTGNFLSLACKYLVEQNKTFMAGIKAVSEFGLVWVFLVFFLTENCLASLYCAPFFGVQLEHFRDGADTSISCFEDKAAMCATVG